MVTSCHQTYEPPIEDGHRLAATMSERAGAKVD
jgi:hypothetical protein